jgi:hypothetical protein
MIEGDLESELERCDAQKLPILKSDLSFGEVSIDVGHS